MGIVTGQRAKAEDFISEAERNANPALDLNKVPKLQEYGALSSLFTLQGFRGVAGEALTKGDVVYQSDGLEFTKQNGFSVQSGGGTSGVITLATPVPVANSFVMVMQNGNKTQYGTAFLSGVVGSNYTTITVSNTALRWQVISHSSFTVQYGTTTYSGTQFGSSTVTFSAVTLAETFLVFNSNQNINQTHTHGEIISTTQATFSSRVSSINTCSGTVHYYVVSWAGATVQRGNALNNTGNANITITSVNTKKAFVIQTYKAGSSTNFAQPVQYTNRAEITASTTLAITRVGASSLDIHWQIISHPSINVEKTTITANGVASVTDNLIPQTLNGAFYATNQDGNATNAEATNGGEGGAFKYINTALNKFTATRAGTASTTVGTPMVVTWHGSGSARTAGKLYKASSATPANAEFSGAENMRVVGLAVADTAVDDPVTVQTTGIFPLLTGLTVGADYYLGADYGTLQTTFTPKKIGRALLATLLELEKANSFTFADTVVYNANPPSGYTDLNLSSIVGAKKSIVFLQVTNRTTGLTAIIIAITDENGVLQWVADDSGGIAFRTKGNNITINLVLNGGVHNADLSTGTGSLASVHEVKVVAFM